MHHFEVIFAKSFKAGKRHIVSTVTEIVQSGKFEDSDAEIDANNKIEKHPLARAGWRWSPPQKMTRQEVEAYREELRTSFIADFNSVN